jgi:hypothetical protein
MIAVLIDTTNDAHLLRKVCEGVEDMTLLVNPTNDEVDRVLHERPAETLLCMGHGFSGGLLATSYFTGHGPAVVVGDRNIELLKDRKLICIFCNADGFADRHPELTGFFTSMFISNQMEAAMFGFSAYDDDIFNEVTLFAERVNRLIKDNTDLSEWPAILRGQAAMEKDYVRFNYDGLQYKGKKR